MTTLREYRWGAMGYRVQADTLTTKLGGASAAKQTFYTVWVQMQSLGEMLTHFDCWSCLEVVSIVGKSLPHSV